MNWQEHKQTAARLGLDWPTVKAIYDELRAHERAAIERTIEARRIAYSALGYSHGGQFKLANRHATTDGDRENVRHFDDVAKELAATELPELGHADPAADLWALVTGEAPELPPAVETMERAIARALDEKPAAPVSPDELLSLPAAAVVANVTEQWLRQLVKAGKISGFRVGRCWLVHRRAVEAFRRHPTAGRPRLELEPAPF